jgi:predicted nucleic acid-binding protein
MRVEVASAILKNKRLGRLSLDTARTAMLALNTVPVRMLPVGSHVGTAFAIAQHHGGSVYDACYIAFARSLDASLATDDEGMAQVAEAVGVTVHRASQGFAALLD